MGSSVCLRPDQRLEEEQHQCEELWTDDSQLQSSFPLPPLSGERSKAPFFFLMTMCRNVRNTAVKENKDYTATTSLRLKSCPTMAKPMVTHHASHPCANPVSVRSRKNKKTKQVEINRMWLQPPNTMKLAAGFDALVGCERSNTFSKKRTAACVWTCLHRLWLCNSFMRKPQGTERVCLIPGTDRGLAGGNCNLSKL